MSEELDAREQDLLAQISAAEDEVNAAERDCINCHQELRQARAAHDQAIAEADAQLNVVLSEDTRLQSIMAQKRAALARLKRELADVRNLKEHERRRLEEEESIRRQHPQV